MARLKLKIPHIFHEDPHWQRVGVHDYRECTTCGARRVRRAYSNLDGPVAVGWPDLADHHGVYRMDSGWVPRPAEGWPTKGKPSG